MSTLSRGGQSRTRLEAYGRLTRAGMSTWDVRLDEKVSRVQERFGDVQIMFVNVTSLARSYDSFDMSVTFYSLKYRHSL